MAVNCRCLKVTDNKEECTHPEGKKQAMQICCVLDNDVNDDGGQCLYFEEPEEAPDEV